jgi:orotate phosphoribosyltransferase
MDQTEVLDVLQKVGAFRAGHFVLTSGRHSDSYVNKDAMYAYTHDLSALCKTIAERVKGRSIEVVAGPAVAAAILAQWVAYHLTAMTGHEVYAVYADKDGQGGFVIKRGYDQLMKGKKTLVVEDLTTTGGSIKKVVEAARAAGADVAGAIAIVNRGEVSKKQVGNPGFFEELVNVHLESWEEDKCELCAKGIPVNVDVGHGREFLARRNR